MVDKSEVRRAYRRAINGYYLEGEVPTIRKLALLPRFVTEGYAVFEGEQDTGFDVVMSDNFDFIERVSLKEGAPLWAVDEYESICKFFADGKDCDRNEEWIVPKSSIFQR